MVFLARALSILGAAWLVAACGTEVAQTAVLDPVGPVDCTRAGAPVLPSSVEFGDGGEPPSNLVGTSYDAGQGPGLYVTARDAFRVYLNGALVTASAVPRTTAFVPLTLLPGDNALSVVVAAQSGTPAALVELDDLDQSTVSSAAWKASTAPAIGYASAAFDDSAWPPATDYGADGSLPGCDPGAAFPAGTAAHWIGPALDTGSTAVLRTVVHLAAVGFGAGTTGGSGATAVTVATWSDYRRRPRIRRPPR